MTVLTTKRLRLRRFEAGDVDTMHQLLSDPQAMAFSTGPMTRSQAKQWIEWNMALYQPGGLGVWAIVDGEGRIVGQAGVMPQQVDEHVELEITYRLMPDCWGRGYATEAAAACREYGFNVLGAERVVSMIDPANVRSRRVAERLGMKLLKRTNRGTSPVDVFSVGREQLPG